MAVTNWGDWLAFGSGVTLVLLGAALLALRPRRRPQVFFAAFAILWGIQIALANVGLALADMRLHATTLLLSYAFLGPAALALVHFATLGASPRASAATWSMAAVATTGTLILLIDPGLVLTVRSEGGASTTVLGPAALPLFVAPFYGAFYVALGLLYRGYHRAPAGTSRERMRWLVLALALFTSYATVRNLVFFASHEASVRVAGQAGAVGMAAFFAVGLLVLAGIALHLVITASRRRGIDKPLLFALFLPALVAAIESALVATPLAMNTLGAWRFATVATLVYALARYQLFSLDLKIKWTLKQSSLIGILVLTFAVVSEALEFVIQDRVGQILGLGVAVLLTYGIAPVQRAVERVIGTAMPQVSDNPDYIEKRKHEVYHAAFESAMADGVLTARERATLQTIRDSLGITAEDAERIEAAILARIPTPAPPPPAATT